MSSKSSYTQFLLQIDKSLKPYIEQDLDGVEAQQVKANQVHERLRALMDEAKTKGNLPDGELHVFGSFSNGFKTGGSDLDIVYISDDIGNGAVRVLQTIMNLCDKYNFNNVTKIFQANVPILKFTDADSGVEVDFCINNRLGVRNSQLLQQYCGIDKRVKEIGRLVKAWAKKKDLVGTADGFLNSYAYMLLVIYFLQVGLEEPLLPNLQAMAQRENFTKDNKWGRDESWDTKFFQSPEDGELTPEVASELTKGQFQLEKNRMREAELLFTFFHFYTRIFDWKTEAVCIRCAEPTTRPSTGQRASNWIRKKCSKYDIMQNTCDKTGQAVPSPGSQQLHQTWYIEDPFDLRHNLAGKMTIQGKRRMLSEMERTMQQLSKSGNWETVCPLKDDFPPLYFLKCRISASVSPDVFIQEMDGFGLIRLHMPKSFQKQRYGVAFLEFHDSKARRRAHTKNESYLNDCQLQIHYSSRWALEDAVAQQTYIHYSVDQYKIDKAEGKSNPGVLDANPGKMPPAPDHIRKAFLEAYGKRNAEYGKHIAKPGVPLKAGAYYPSSYFGPPYATAPGLPLEASVAEKLRNQKERQSYYRKGPMFPVQTRVIDEKEKELTSVSMPVYVGLPTRIPPPPKALGPSGHHPASSSTALGAAEYYNSAIQTGGRSPRQGIEHGSGSPTATSTSNPITPQNENTMSKRGGDALVEAEAQAKRIGQRNKIREIEEKSEKVPLGPYLTTQRPANGAPGVIRATTASENGGIVAVAGTGGIANSVSGANIIPGGVAGNGAGITTTAGNATTAGAKSPTVKPEEVRKSDQFQ